MTTVGVTKADADSAPNDVAIAVMVSSVRYVSPPFCRIIVPASRAISSISSMGFASFLDIILLYAFSPLTVKDFTFTQLQKSGFFR